MLNIYSQHMLGSLNGLLVFSNLKWEVLLHRLFTMSGDLLTPPGYFFSDGTVPLHVSCINSEGCPILFVTYNSLWLIVSQL